jgi:hypothetical protein
MASTFASQIPGEDTAADTSLSFYLHKVFADNTIRAAMPKNDDGYLVVFPYGTAGASPAAADKCDIWPSRISSNVKRYTAANEAAMFVVSFAITATPTDDTAVV